MSSESGGPQSRRANALPATRGKLKTEDKCGPVVVGRKRSERRKGGSGEGFCNIFPSPGILFGRDAVVFRGI